MRAGSFSILFTIGTLAIIRIAIVLLCVGGGGL